MPESTNAERLAAATAATKYACWILLGGQEFVNQVVRIAIAYIVPFIASEQAFSAAQTARLLSGFSLGYVTCQVRWHT